MTGCSEHTGWQRDTEGVQRWKPLRVSFEAWKYSPNLMGKGWGVVCCGPEVIQGAAGYWQMSPSLSSDHCELRKTTRHTGMSLSPRVERTSTAPLLHRLPGFIYLGSLCFLIYKLVTTSVCATWLLWISNMHPSKLMKSKTCIEHYYYCHMK